MIRCVEAALQRMRSLAVAASVLTLVATSATLLFSPVVAHAATEPPVYDSWYVNNDWYNTFVGTNNSPFYNFGCDQPNGAKVILDFAIMGNPSSGVYEFDPWEYGWESISTVETQITSLLKGYTSCGHTQQLDLIIGTSNSNADTNSYNWSGMGQALAGVVNYFSVTSLYDVEAGDDIEAQWSTPTNVMTFLSGYNGADTGSRYLYDYGWLDGTTNTSGTSYTYPNGWTPADADAAVWLDTYDYPYLELYDGTANGNTGSNDWGVQNADLDAYNNAQYGVAWFQMGVLTENVSGTETPSEAFSDQEKALGTLGTSIAWNSQIQP